MYQRIVIYFMSVLLQDHWDIFSKHMHCSSLYLYLLCYASVWQCM